MYVGLKQARGDGERYVTPARAAAKETNLRAVVFFSLIPFTRANTQCIGSFMGFT